MVSVLMLCSVTALAFGFAMQNRYDSIVHFENTYTYQIISDRPDYGQEFQDLITIDNSIDYASSVEVTVLENEDTNRQYAFPLTLLSYSQIQNLAQDAGLEFDFPEPQNQEYIELHHLYLMSLTNDTIINTETIQGTTYTSITKSSAPYLGYMQESMDYMIVNDATYQALKPLGSSFYLYNYKISDPLQFEASVDDIQTSPHCQGLVKIDPEREDIAWIKTLYSFSIFMFMVFVFASGAILFMKIYNDAFEEKDRYQVLQKLGVDSKVLKKALAHELKFAYIAPLIVMSISSYFSVKALGNLMQSSFLSVNIISVLII